MPRNPKYVALAKLEAAKANYARAEKAARLARLDLNNAMVKAVEAGVTRGEVAKIVGVTQSRVAQIPGMPAAWVQGANEELGE